MVKLLAKEAIEKLHLKLAQTYYEQGLELQVDGFDERAKEYFNRARDLGLQF